MLEFFLVALIAVVGSFVQATTGFGYALIVMAFWPLFLPFRTAAALEIATALMMVLYIAFQYRKHINWKIVVWPILTTILFNLIGFQFMIGSAESLLRRMMGGMLLLLFLHFVFFAKKLTVKPTPAAGLAAGVIGGLCGGMLGIGGPPMVAYFISSTDDKKEYVATLQCYFVISGVQMVIVHAVSGSFTPDILQLGIVALAGVAVGTLAGFLLFKRLPMQHLKKLIYLLLGCLGLYLLIVG